MKNIFIILFTLSSYCCFSQILIPTYLDHDTCLNKKFSIVFYVVLDSNYSMTTAPQPTLDMVIDTLNSRFSHICVSFESCSTVVIPIYPYNTWSKDVTDPVVTSNWYTDKTINFYVVDTMKPSSTNIELCCGYAYPPPVGAATPTDVIVLERKLLVVPGNGPLFHAMGHFFGLSHTSSELNPGNPATPMPPTGVVTQEFADESNGYLHGDMLSDTEADPGSPSLYVDGKGQRYIPPMDNYMFTAMAGTCKYTQQQYNLMAYMIMTRRLYLH